MEPSRLLSLHPPLRQDFIFYLSRAGGGGRDPVTDLPPHAAFDPPRGPPGSRLASASDRRDRRSLPRPRPFREPRTSRRPRALTAGSSQSHTTRARAGPGRRLGNEEEHEAVRQPPPQGRGQAQARPRGGGEEKSRGRAPNTFPSAWDLARRRPRLPHAAPHAAWRNQRVPEAEREGGRLGLEGLCCRRAGRRKWRGRGDSAPDFLPPFLTRSRPLFSAPSVSLARGGGGRMFCRMRRIRLDASFKEAVSVVHFFETGEQMEV